MRRSITWHSWEFATEPTEAGCAKIFTEQMSGAVTGRPALHDALEFARSGDTLIVWKNDPGFWLDPKNEPLAAYTKQGVLGPTIPPYEVFNPARAQVSTEHVFAIAMNDVMRNGMTPQAAIDKAFKRTDEIFAKYPIAES